MKLPKFLFARSVVLFDLVIVPLSLGFVVVKLSAYVPEDWIGLFYTLAALFLLAPISANVYYVLRRGREVMLQSVIKQGEVFHIVKFLWEDHLERGIVTSLMVSVDRFDYECRRLRFMVSITSTSWLELKEGNSYVLVGDEIQAHQEDPSVSEMSKVA